VLENNQIFEGVGSLLQGEQFKYTCIAAGTAGAGSINDTSAMYMSNVQKYMYFN
jgi:hypothetical protein